jgi:hypothetical protein
METAQQAAARIAAMNTLLNNEWSPNPFGVSDKYCMLIIYILQKAN